MVRYDDKTQKAILMRYSLQVEIYLVIKYTRTIWAGFYMPCSKAYLLVYVIKESDKKKNHSLRFFTKKGI